MPQGILKKKEISLKKRGKRHLDFEKKAKKGIFKKKKA
jgi:hypothetical protein